MALFEEQITDTLETGAPSIKYEGDEGPQDPRQEQMLAQLKEEYMQYVFEQNEIGEPVMSFEEWYQMTYEASKMGVQAPQEEMMMREPAAYGGIMDTDSGRRAYGLGSIFKKITKIPKKIFKGVKKIAKSPVGKIGIAALLGGMPIGTGAWGSLGNATKAGWFGKGSGIGALRNMMGGSDLAKNIGKKLFEKEGGGLSLAKAGIAAASALPFFGFGTKAKQDQMPEGFTVSGDWDENFKTAGGFPGMRRAIAQSKDKAELEALSEKFGFTPGLFENFADGGRIGYAGGEMVEGMAEGIEKIRPGSMDVIEKIKEGIIEGGGNVAEGIEKIRPGSMDVIEKIKEGIIEGGGNVAGPFIDEAIWIEKIKDFIRKKRGERDRRKFSPDWKQLPMRPLPSPDWKQDPIRPLPRKPMPDMPDIPRRRYALGSKADFAIEDVMTGGMEDEIGGITGIMRQADLQRKGNVGQFYAAQGGRIGYAGGNYVGSKQNVTLSDEYNSYLKEGGTMSFPSFVEMMREDRAQGGRIGAQEGGIMDLGGMEKDYRNTGGFVDLGAKEKADDVPARLSVNEFVMTADAVRGAGDGDIDKGASIMENMMKELEQKGQEDMKMAGPDWYIKRIEHLMYLGYSYDEASRIAYDSEKYHEVVGHDAKKGAEDMFEVSERLSEVV